MDELDEEAESIELSVITDEDARSFHVLTAEQLAWSRARDHIQPNDLHDAQTIINRINARRGLLGLPPIL